MNETKTLDWLGERKKPPGSMNKPISSSPGLFQRQIKGFGGPSLARGTFPHSGPEWAFMGGTALSGWGDMKGAGQALKARLIPTGGNRGPVFSQTALLLYVATHR